MIDQLASSSLFGNLGHFSIVEISKICTKLELIDGDTLISENDLENFDLYILCAGNVEIVSRHKPTITGEVVLSKRDTELFGEIGWLLRKKRTATVRCIGEVDAIRINGDLFMTLLEQHPDMGFQVMRNLSTLITRRMSQASGLLKQILWNIDL